MKISFRFMAAGKSVTAAFLAWLLLVAAWNAHDFIFRYAGNGMPIDASDVLVLMMQPAVFGILVFPEGAAAGILCKRDAFRYPVLIRMGSRVRIFRKQATASFICAAVLSGLFAAVAVGVSRAGGLALFSWQNTDSLYQSTTGGVCSFSFLPLLMVVLWSCWVRFAVVFLLQDILMWIRKAEWFLWVFVSMLICYEFTAYYSGLPTLCMIWRKDMLPYYTGICAAATLFLTALWHIGGRICEKKDIL